VPARREVDWTDGAKEDLRAIIEHIADDSPGAALRSLRRIRESAESLNVMPGRGRMIPELAPMRDASFRELILVPWRIAYRISDRTVTVFAVVDARRDLAALLNERASRPT